MLEPLQELKSILERFILLNLFNLLLIFCFTEIIISEFVFLLRDSFLTFKNASNWVTIVIGEGCFSWISER